MSKSARGLFRATGKTPTVEPVREEHDFYPTPPEPIRAFIHAEQSRLIEFDAVWEAAAGDGALVREMEAMGYTVKSSDLIDRGCGADIRSFYDFGPNDAPAKAIVTNPPFAECNKDPGWVRHALEVIGVEYMALLLPLNWLGAAGRAGLWAQYPPARIHLMRWRIDFTGQGAPPMLNAWYVWDRAHVGEPVLRMMDRKDARQAELFEEAA